MARTLFFNPLKSDPSRTGLIRRQFSVEMFHRFTRLKQQIKRWLSEGGLGQFTVNVFCPTGEGGGVDPTCSPPNGGRAGKLAKIHQKTAAIVDRTLASLMQKYGVDPSRTALVSQSGGTAYAVTQTGIRRLITKEEAASIKFAGGKVHQLGEKLFTFDQGDTIALKTDGTGLHFGLSPERFNALRAKNGWHVKTAMDAVEATITHEFAHVLQHMAGLSPRALAVPVPDDDKELAKTLGRYAQTSYGEFLAEAFVAYESGRADLKPIIDRFVKSLTANARRGRWATNPQKIEAFNSWLKQQVDSGILEQSHEPWTVKYTKRAYNKGYSRTYNEVRRRTVNDPKKRAAGLEELMRRQQDVGAGKLQILASRAFEDLKGVTTQMSSQISRELVSGVLNGDSPETIAQAMSKRVDIGLNRARTIARTEIAHAHAESQLDALEDMGLEDVGIMVEWINGVDPCPRCAKMFGKIMKVKTARGKIPLHPNCMCAFVPVVKD